MIPFGIFSVLMQTASEKYRLFERTKHNSPVSNTYQHQICHIVFFTYGGKIHTYKTSFHWLLFRQSHQSDAHSHLTACHHRQPRQEQRDAVNNDVDQGAEKNSFLRPDVDHEGPPITPLAAMYSTGSIQ